MKNTPFLSTSESVTEGHPDKICDQISDAILDAYLEQDKFSRCAIECMATTNRLFIAGEVSSKARLNHKVIAREIIADIGYANPALGFHDGCRIDDLIHNQSKELRNNEGAGDQGIVFGYACSHSEELMPLPIVFAQRLTTRLTEVRRNNIVEGLYPDGKSQVTIKYVNRKPVSVDSIFISAHHDERYKNRNRFDEFIAAMTQHVVHSAVPEEMLTDKTKIIVNPLGPWYRDGGPAADTGLTGRKIISDTYGGWGKHGGGAFSGKDGTKVDRSGAYFARHIAKNIVGHGFADECEIQMGYAIGDELPCSLFVNTFGTERTEIEEIVRFVHLNFNLKVKDMIDYLDLRKPIYRRLSKQCHFGLKGYKWEELLNKTERKTQ